MINTCRLRFMVKPHTSDIRMTYEYIRATYGWHTSTYEWDTDNIREHMSDIRMTYEYIQVTYEHIRMPYEYLRVTYRWHTSTYEWHTDDIRIHTVLGYLPKLKKGLELTFGAHFLHGFFHTNAPYLILYQLTKFQRYIFLQNTKQNVLLSSYLHNWWRHKLYDYYIQSSSKKITEGEGMRGSQNYNFLDEVKSIFHKYFNAIICWIKEK